MLYNQPNTRVLGEPFALSHINLLHQLGLTTTTENRNLIRSAVRLNLKVSPGSKIDRIAIKLSGYNASQMQIMSEEFPKFKYVSFTISKIHVKRLYWMSK